MFISEVENYQPFVLASVIYFKIFYKQKPTPTEGVGKAGKAREGGGLTVVSTFLL